MQEDARRFLRPMAREGGTDCKNAVYTSPQGEKAAISGGGIDGKNAAYLLLDGYNPHYQGVNMECHLCKFEVPENSVFCLQCGVRLNPVLNTMKSRFGGVTAQAEGNISVGNDIVGRDKIVAFHVNWYEASSTETDERWMQEAIIWLRNKYDGRRSYRFNPENFCNYAEKEADAKVLSDLDLYTRGRFLFDSRQYAEAAAYFAELRQREPSNNENEAYLRLCLSKVAREIRVESAVKNFNWHGSFRISAWYLRICNRICESNLCSFA